MPAGLHPNHYDVIVVGAGPAGASAAYGLARAGLRVLILEKDKLPRYKTCGGGLSPKVTPALAGDFSPVVEQAISSGQVTSPFAPPVYYDLGQVAGWCVMRDQFDYHLVQRAVSAGAHLREGTAVRRVTTGDQAAEVETRADTYTAQVVVGADGVNGVVARTMGLARDMRYAAALEAEIEVVPAALEAQQGCLRLHFGGVPWGYAWVFPKARHLSVGVGTFQDRRALNLRALLRQFLAGEPGLSEHTVLKLRGQRIPLGGQRGPLHRGRVLLAGDAGGFADPFLGEGIAYALQSGQWAAEVAAEAVIRGDCDLSDYTRRVQAGLHREFRYTRLFAAVFYRSPGVWTRLLARSPKFQGFTARMLGSGFSYRQSVLHSPWLGLRLAADLLRPRRRAPAVPL